MSDKREPGLTVEEYRDLIVPSYQTVIMKLMGGYQSSIRTHSFMADKVISKNNLLDTRSVIPSMFNTEMSEVNHAKFYPVGDTFVAVGMYLGFRTSAMQTGSRESNHNAIMRELTIGWDRAALAGEYGNKGLLKSSIADPKRVVKDSVELPKASADFATRAQGVKNLGAALKNTIDETTASENVSVLVYGTALQNYMSDTNSATDISSLFDYFRKGFGEKFVNIIEVPALALAGSALANENGITVVSNGTLEMDTVGYPDIDKVGVDSNEAGDFDWTRFAVGSVQITTNTVGGIINQALTIKQ